LLSGLSPSLKQLYITGYKAITSVEPNTFQHLPNLEKLSLVNNSIAHIEPAAFNNLNKLTQLELSNNRLTDFRFGEPLANAEPCCLKVLYLSDNQLSFFPKRLVTNLPTSLVNLDLSSNKIMGLESGAFEDLVNLRSLNLERNHHKSFETLDLNNILNNDTCNLRLLDICEASFKTIQWREYSKDIEERAKTNLKRKQSEEDLTFPIKSLRNRVLVCVHESQDSCQAALNKLVDEGIVRMRIYKS
jgi:Leucine-rich repeat (LRR) protein